MAVPRATRMMRAAGTKYGGGLLSLATAVMFCEQRKESELLKCFLEQLLFQPLSV